MAKSMYKYYVGILGGTGETITYVTSIDNASKFAKREAGKPAKAFNHTGAKNLVFGLVANGTHAVVIEAPNFYELNNPEK